MRRLIATAIVGIAMLCVFVTVWAWQKNIAAGLRSELASVRTQHRLGVRLQEENKRLQAMQLSPRELTRLRADRTALLRAREEIASLEQMLTDSGKRISAAAKANARRPVHSLSSSWRDRGRSTPEATLETALWSAAGGDVEALAACLELSPAARAKAVALYEGLPAEVRARHRSPEQFIALLTTDAIGYRAMTIVAAATNRATSTLVVDFETPEGKRRSAQLALSRTDDEWRLLVPETAIDRYAAMLKAPDSPR